MHRKPVVPLNCFFKGSYEPAYEAEIAKCKAVCHRYNRLPPRAEGKRQKLLRRLLGRMGRQVTFVPPFWCDYGYNIEVGDRFYANHGLVVQDGAKVRFGSDVFIAPHCVVTTAEHAVDPQLRKEGYEVAKPVTVGSNVWIGAGAVILAGVTIGDNTVIGAGSVVTRSVPANVVAAGVPCRVLRAVTEEDRLRYPMDTENRV